jgi:hypothetical protein
MISTSSSLFEITIIRGTGAIVKVMVQMFIDFSLNASSLSLQTCT